MATSAALTVDDAFEAISALYARLEAIEFERLAQGLKADPWRFRSLAHFRVTASNIEYRLEEEGMTALNRLRFDEFLRELDAYGIATDDAIPRDPKQSYESWVEDQLRRTKDRLRDAEHELLDARRLLYRHSDEEVLDALRAVDDGATSATRVAAQLWGGSDAPHHFVIRVGHALGRLRKAGLVAGRDGRDALAPKKWSVVDA